MAYRTSPQHTTVVSEHSLPGSTVATRVAAIVVVVATLVAVIALWSRTTVSCTTGECTVADFHLYEGSRAESFPPRQGTLWFVNVEGSDNTVELISPSGRHFGEVSRKFAERSVEMVGSFEDKHPTRFRESELANAPFIALVIGLQCLGLVAFGVPIGVAVVVERGVRAGVATRYRARRGPVRWYAVDGFDEAVAEPGEDDGWAVVLVSLGTRSVIHVARESTCRDVARLFNDAKS